MTEKIKHAAAAAFVILGLGGFYTLGSPWGQLAFAVGVLLSAVVLWTSEAGRRFIAYARDAVVEVKKMVWPTRKETIQTTAVVFVFVCCMALFLWIVDKGLEWVIYSLILNWKG